MFARIIWYGFILPSDIETMKSELLTRFGIQVNECRKDDTVTLVEDDSQVMCTLYDVPAHTRKDEEAAARLQSAIKRTIFAITLVKTVMVVDSMKSSVPAHS
ncbi:MAG: hypothetical protein V4682_01370 [Patescibacteria group bacterium]